MPRYPDDPEATVRVWALIKRGLTIEEIAEKLNYSPRWVAELRKRGEKVDREGFAAVTGTGTTYHLPMTATVHVRGWLRRRLYRGR